MRTYQLKKDRSLSTKNKYRLGVRGIMDILCTVAQGRISNERADELGSMVFNR